MWIEPRRSGRTCLNGVGAMFPILRKKNICENAGLPTVEAQGDVVECEEEVAEMA